MGRAIRLLLDENVHGAVAAALRERGIDAVHAVDVGLRGSSDVAVLEAAIAAERLLVTRDYRDFAVLVDGLHRARRRFPGVLFVAVPLARQRPGSLVDAIVRFAEAPEGVPAGTVAWLTAEPR